MMTISAFPAILPGRGIAVISHLTELLGNGSSRTGLLSDNVAMCGGGGVDGTEKEMMVLGSLEEDVEKLINRVGGKAPVVFEISEKVGWQDDLFWKT